MGGLGDERELGFVTSWREGGFWGWRRTTKIKGNRREGSCHAFCEVSVFSGMVQVVRVELKRKRISYRERRRVKGVGGGVTCSI